MDYFEVRIGITPKEPWSDVLSQELASAGFDSFTDTPAGINAYIPVEKFNKDELDRILDQFAHSFSNTVHISRIDSRNWNEIWEKSFEPVWIRNRLIVKAPFHTLNDKKPELEIIIEPKMAFGTGHHDTTWLMMDKMLDMELKGKKVVDMGCGSGILTILASKLGASRIHALDIEEAAVANTLENLAMNNCESVLVEKGGLERLSGRDNDVILANINRNTLLALMKPFAERLTDQGRLLISGFFETDSEVLEKEALAAGFGIEGKKTRNGWCMLEFRKLN